MGRYAGLFFKGKANAPCREMREGQVVPALIEDGRSVPAELSMDEGSLGVPA